MISEADFQAPSCSSSARPVPPPRELTSSSSAAALAASTASVCVATAATAAGATAEAQLREREQKKYEGSRGTGLSHVEDPRCQRDDGNGHNGSQQKDLFSIVDRNHDCTISYHEWLKAFDIIDINHDGIITRKEWYLRNGETHEFDAIKRRHLARITREEWQIAFKSADRVRDGKLTRKEWSDFVHKLLVCDHSHGATEGCSRDGGAVQDEHAKVAAMFDMRGDVRDTMARASVLRANLKRSEPFRKDPRVEEERERSKVFLASLEARSRRMLREAMEMEEGKRRARSLVFTAVTQATQVAKEKRCQNLKEAKALRQAILAAEQALLPKNEYIKAIELQKTLADLRAHKGIWTGELRDRSSQHDECIDWRAARHPDCYFPSELH